MPRRRRNCRRDSYSSEFDDIDNISLLELATSCSSTGRRAKPRAAKRRATLKKSPAPQIPRDVNNSIIVLDDSDEDCLSTVISRSRAINENVISKVDDIFKTSGLLSDDEDEPHVVSSTSINIPKQNINMSSINVNEPSTSTCGSRVLDSPTSDKCIVVKDHEINTIEEIQNYCKETEDILRSANAILAKFAGTTCPVEEQPKKIESKDDTGNQNEKKKLECPICYEDLSGKPAMTTKCGHLFCKTCIEKVAMTIKRCPTCRKVINKKNIIPIYI